MTWAAALCAVAACCALAAWFQVPAQARTAFGVSRRAFADLRDPALDDAARERAAQAHARQLAWLCLRILLGSAAALALPFGGLALGSALGWLHLGAVVELSLSPWFLLVAAVLAAAILHLLRRRPS